MSFIIQESEVNYIDFGFFKNVAQGSIGGGLVSALNLSETMTDYFSGSDSDISYGLVRANPILYQDDSARFSSSI